MDEAALGVLAQPDEPRHTPSSGGIWRVASVFGEILMTVGVVLLLMVVYELFWTNVVAEQQADQEREELLNTWRESTSTADLPPIPSQAFGLMYIPRLQSDVWATPLIQGVGADDLAKGIGHVPETAMPGEVGNAAFAGHRATHGQPLANVDQLQVGDLVHIETASGWYTYTLTHDQLVQPDEVWVTDPVPGQPPGTVPTTEMLTMITCDPRWGSTRRWIWWGELSHVRSQAQGPPGDVVELMAGG